MEKSVLAVLILSAAISACGQNDDATLRAATKSEPQIPSMTITELVALNKNERAEMDRRCLGVQHKTCSDYKSEAFRKVDDLERSFCNLADASGNLYGAAKPPPTEKCKVYF